MTWRQLVRSLWVLAFLVLAPGTRPVSGAPDPVLEAPPPDKPSDWLPLAVPARADLTGPLIIDHTCTDLSQIPPQWIEQAKQLTFHIAHTSHGSQILSGIRKLESIDPTYSVQIVVNANVTQPTEAGALGIYDGNNRGDDTYITPEEYWSTQSGISSTQSVADTGWFGYSTWTWCGQQSSNSESTVQQYLGVMSDLEAQYPNMRFILMTEHTDGITDGTLKRNNDMVRQYAQDNDRVLFDFADIERYTPLGDGPYVNNGEGTCTWCVDFCADHPDYCTDLPDSCAHSSAHTEDRLFCKLKGNAFWWMMARLAGWDPDPTAVESDFSSSTKAVSPSEVQAGQRVTYTVAVRNTTGITGNSVTLRDTVPVGLIYVPGTLTATAGTVSDVTAPVLTWTLPLMTAPVVTVTYGVTVAETLSTSQTITNAAVIASADTQPITRTAALSVVHFAPDFSGSTKSVSPVTAKAGQRVTYTLAIRNGNPVVAEAVALHDALPEGLSYISGTLTATTGMVDDTVPPTLTWHMAGMGQAVVTLTYAARVDPELVEPWTIANTAVISATDALPVACAARLRIGWSQVYLPVVVRAQVSPLAASRAAMTMGCARH